MMLNIERIKIVIIKTWKYNIQKQTNKSTKIISIVLNSTNFTKDINGKLTLENLQLRDIFTRWFRIGRILGQIDSGRSDTPLADVIWGFADFLIARFSRWGGILRSRIWKRVLDRLFSLVFIANLVAEFGDVSVGPIRSVDPVWEAIGPVWSVAGRV